MKFFIFLSIVSIITGCIRSYPIHKLSEKQQLVNQLRKEVALQLHQERGLIPCGTGGQMMNQIQMLALSFDYRQPVDIDKSRELLITAVDTFVAAINANEAVRPYLGNYPFTPKNIELRVFLQNPDRSNVQSGQLSIVTSIAGIFEYDIKEPDYPLHKTIHHEPYEEAVQRFQGTAPSPFVLKPQPLIEFPHLIEKSALK